MTGSGEAEYAIVDLPLTPDKLKAARQGGGIAAIKAEQRTPGRFHEGPPSDKPESVMLCLEHLPHAKQHPDLQAFFAGEAADFPPFELPAASLGERDMQKLESRLFHFAHFTRPFSWVDDPRASEFRAMATDLSLGGPADRVDGDVQFLWDYLFGVARSARFVEGALDARNISLLRVANEVRRRLLGLGAVPERTFLERRIVLAGIDIADARTDAVALPTDRTFRATLSGASGAVHRMAGPGLAEACKSLPLGAPGDVRRVMFCLPDAELLWVFEQTARRLLEPSCRRD